MKQLVFLVFIENGKLGIVRKAPYIVQQFGIQRTISYFLWKTSFNPWVDLLLLYLQIVMTHAAVLGKVYILLTTSLCAFILNLRQPV